MRNTIEILFGEGVAKGARLEWVKVASTAGPDAYDTYVDLATIRLNGNSAKMWHLHDFKTEQMTRGMTYCSAKNWVEYDLENARRRTLYFSWNTRPMGEGDTVYRMDEPSEWRAMVPGSIADMLSKIASGEHPVAAE